MNRILLFLILLIISGCNSSSSNINQITGSDVDKCPEKPEAVLDAKDVKTINLSTQKITESGIVNQQKSVGYTFSGQVGQKLVYQTSQDICISVYTPDNQILNSGVLPIDGKYIIQISIHKGSMTFDLAMNLITETTSVVSTTTITATNINKSVVPSPTNQNFISNTTPIPVITPSTLVTNNVYRPSPEKVLETYYTKINNRQYQDAWQILPVEVQDNKELHPNGYNSFLEWWDKVNFVDIQNISLAESNQNFATVNLQSKYQMKSGRQAPINLNFYMKWNESNQRWDITSIKVEN
ncbi:MAG: hypothetical protein SAK29_32395 [Scytonema sp. PMC 1069.18]|nr:hypothetical protein [Scytonema sp. PMC 1069.18]MEC4880736.1 hypothetical protein [Scytonema sp. PMC 1070.18]